MADWRQFHPKGKTVTRGDVGAAALGYTVGFAVDIFLFPIGAPPGTTAGVFAVGAVGLKNAAQAALEKHSMSKRDTPPALEERYKAFKTLLETDNQSNTLQEIEKAHHLWEKGIDDDNEFCGTMADLITKYKTGRRPSRRGTGRRGAAT